MPSHFKVKEYCPIVFRNLRERFGIDDQDYMVSTSCPIVFRNLRERFGIDDQDYMVSTPLLCSETYERDSVLTTKIIW